VTGTSPLLRSTYRRPRPRWVRLLRVTAVVLLVVLLAVAVMGGVLWAYAWARLGATDVPALAAEGEDALGAGGATAPTGTTTVLVALTEDDGEGDGRPASAGPVALVQVGGPRGEDAAVLVLPQQLPVNVEGEATMPLGDVHELGGLDLLTRTIVDYTQIAVDHVVAATEDAVPSLVDAVGPVEVCTIGCREVDAAGARTSVASFQQADPASTPAAVGELAALLEQLARRTDPVGVLASPLATKRAVDVVADDVTTDVSLRGAVLLQVADRLAGAGQVAVVTLPGVVNPDSGQLLVLPEQSATRFALLREGGVPDATVEDDEADVLAGATVAVQNGTGTAGYASALESRLAASGVSVVGTGNADSFDVERTVVRYGPDDPAAEAAAVLLARELGDVELEELERSPSFEGDPVTVLVVGGADLDDGEAPADGEG
jgi:hypothetical protein